MFATAAIQVPLLVLPLLQLPPPTSDCQLEVLTPQAMEERALSEFALAVDQYAGLHRRLARALPMPLAFDEGDGFDADELRRALVAARPGVRAGGFFTPQVARLLTERIDSAFLFQPVAAEAVTRGGYEPLPGEPGPVVNQPFPRVIASTRWLPLLRVLPPLPRELDFALWGRDLVLVDIAANLVLDVLPDALPPAAEPGVLYP